MASLSPATRASLFMRQCRYRNTQTNTSQTRQVSSSHLAPSNFSKPLRVRTDETTPSSSQPTDRRLPDPKTLTRPHNLRVSDLPPPITESRQKIPSGFIAFLKYKVLSLPLPHVPSNTTTSLTIKNNPYRARKTWPPDFRLLHAKQQFHFEKKYRRRLIVKSDSQRYNWNRYTKLLQQTLIVITVLYFLFIADPYEKDGGGTPVDGFRAWFFGQIGKFEHLPGHLTEQAADLEKYYKKNNAKAPWNQGKDDASPVAGLVGGGSEGLKTE